MTTVFWALFAFYAVIVLLWIGGLVWVRLLRTDEGMQLEPVPQAKPNPGAPTLRVFLAAHNEEERIGPCLDRLLRQNYANLRVTVVNDRSDDGTAERVRVVMTQASSDRLDLVEIDHLPPGWIGKTHALAVAASEVDSDYLLFMDCDCRLAPGAIAAVMRKVLEERLEFVSLWPRLELLSPWERILTPVASWILGLWAAIHSSRGSQNSDVNLGNGQFMLLSRRVYEAVGGHASVQAELVEDMAIARKAAALGCKRWAGLGRGLYVTSRDNAFGPAVNAITRVLIGGLVEPWRVLVSTQLLYGVFLPLGVLPVSAYYAISANAPQGWAFLAASVVHVFLMSRVVRRMSVLVFEECPPVTSFMVGAAVSLPVLVRAYVVMTGRAGIRWGKTSYQVRGPRIVSATSGHGRADLPEAAVCGAVGDGDRSRARTR